MKSFLLVFVFSLIHFISLSSGNHPAISGFKKSDFIFFGQVIGIEEKYDATIVEMEITSIFKGRKRNTVKLIIDTKNDQYKLIHSYKYIIYSDKIKDIGYYSIYRSVELLSDEFDQELDLLKTYVKKSPLRREKDTNYQYKIGPCGC